MGQGAAWPLLTALSSVAVLGLWSGSAAGQDLELFEEVEQTNSAANRRGGRSGGANPAAPSLTEPEFVLVGTSRIGERRRVVLTHRSGEVLNVPLADSGQTVIPGHGQFRIIASEAGRVGIQYPVGSSCVGARDRGVSCDGGTNIAWLTLRPAALPEQPPADIDSGAEALAETGAATRAQALEAAEELARDPDNPFARLRSQALGGDVPPGRQFRPRRIDPAEVPPGMRVVSTPFGDRLVEID